MGTGVSFQLKIPAASCRESSIKQVHDMKKLAVTFVMVFVICAPGLPYAQSQKPLDVASELQQIESVLYKTVENLRHIGDDLKELQRHTVVGVMVFHALGTIEYCWLPYYHIAGSLLWHPCIKAECRRAWRDVTIEELQGAKRTQNPSVQRLDVAYRGIKNQEALHQVDKARDIIRSSLPLLDKAIHRLEQELRKGEK
jgi:hypothetical protein